MTIDVSKVDTENSTSTALDNGSSFVGEWQERATDGNQIVLAIAADQDCSYKVEFSTDGTNVDSTLTFTYQNGVIEQPKVIEVLRRFYRVTVTNSSGSNMTYLRMQTSAGRFGQPNTPLNGTITSDHNATIVRTIDFEIDAGQGNYYDYQLRERFGADSDLSTADVPEDLWDGADVTSIYPGFPVGDVEEVTITRSSASDTGSIQFEYLASETATEYQTSAWIPLTGTDTDTGVTAWRVGRVIYDSGDDTTFNVGTLTVRHKTTSANVFSVIPIGFSQSQVTAFTVPYQSLGYIRDWQVQVSRQQNANIRFALWVREYGKSPRLIRTSTASNTSSHSDRIFGGIGLPERTDVIVRIVDCSANNVAVFGRVNYGLVRN